MQQLKNMNKTDKHIHTHKKRYLEVISRSTRFKEFNREKKLSLCTFHNHWCMPTQAHLLWINNFWLYTSNLCHNTKPIQILSLINLTDCENSYNLTPVESNSDESKFWLSRIKVLVPRCRKPYYLHSLSQIYLSKHVVIKTSIFVYS
jgi:hypothetical protein